MARDQTLGAPVAPAINRVRTYYEAQSHKLATTKDSSSATNGIVYTMMWMVVHWIKLRMLTVNIDVTTLS